MMEGICEAFTKYKDPCPRKACKIVTVLTHIENTITYQEKRVCSSHWKSFNMGVDVFSPPVRLNGERRNQRVKGEDPVDTFNVGPNGEFQPMCFTDYELKNAGWEKGDSVSHPECVPEYIITNPKLLAFAKRNPPPDDWKEENLFEEISLQEWEGML